MIIAPQKQFLIERHLNNPSDTATYYCRATIINSVTGATIDSFNLTDNGGKYFSKLWITPADVSGSGLQITISTTVYDDSGYSTESVVYGTSKQTYIVKDLAGARLFGGYAGPGDRTPSVDYEKIKRIVLEIIKGIPPADKYDDSKIHERLNELENCMFVLNDKPGPEDKSGEIIKSIPPIIDSANKKIADKMLVIEAMSNEKINNLAEEIKYLAEELSSVDDVKKQIFEFTKSVDQKIEKMKEEILDSLSKPITIQTPRISKEEEKPKPSPRDLAILKLLNQ